MAKTDIENFARLRQRLRAGVAIIDGEARPCRVLLRDRDVAFRRVGADDGCAKSRQRFAENAAAATDIEHSQAGEAVEPQRIAVEMLSRPVANVSRAAPD